jgi:hypothetical protein
VATIFKELLLGSLPQDSRQLPYSVSVTITNAAAQSVDDALKNLIRPLGIAPLHLGIGLFHG